MCVFCLGLFIVFEAFRCRTLNKCAPASVSFSFQNCIMVSFSSNSEICHFTARGKKVHKHVGVAKLGCYSKPILAGNFLIVSLNYFRNAIYTSPYITYSLDGIVELWRRRESERGMVKRPLHIWILHRPKAESNMAIMFAEAIVVSRKQRKTGPWKSRMDGRGILKEASLDWKRGRLPSFPILQRL